MVDYIVVGFGLAGLSFVDKLESNDKSYLVYENSSEQSSRVAGGLYNPVILKRFTLAWLASEQLELAISVYQNIEDKLKGSLISKLPILRRFNDVKEQNLWFEAYDKPLLNKFLSSNLIKNENEALDIPFCFGKVKHTGKIDVKKMLSLYLSYIEDKKCLIKESFEYDKLVVKEGLVEYKGIKARNLVFSEGYGVRNNPFFNYLPLQGNKGEYIIIKSEQLKLSEAVKSSIFIIPLGDDLYKVGATYNNQDKTSGITKSARENLQNKLERFLKVEYEVIDQVTGIRPTTRDRRPFVGTHSQYKNLHIINGLGSRGILIGPYVTEKLYAHIENGEDLDEEIDIKRYSKLR
ncbi:Glycine/D-amino acid oxidase [Aquimarina amphilecti]|uniref:Glycine/D-amino acid oxidase n=1 Tax=Aquimarina amphilecti TaxID=1038014 RepID=A0A1H7RZU0_AQUAM|nr:FAD-dependent oxidoreductase [Aquimarina amphilecti]SEL65753.1 Glycine/D-amino acid oxidase [Aquimarina amphilecti]